MVRQTASPVPLSDAVRDRFRRQRVRDTAPEIALRRAMHRRGLRYRLDADVIPGKRRRVDIVFPRLKVAVDVRGCYWHACKDHGLRPKNNADWWNRKLQRTVARDKETEQLLRAAGWRYVIVWEHEDPTLAADRVAAEVMAAKGACAGRPDDVRSRRP